VLRNAFRDADPFLNPQHACADTIGKKFDLPRNIVSVPSDL
jgi:hypothetical protein